MSTAMAAPGLTVKTRASSAHARTMSESDRPDASSPATTVPSSPASFDNDNRTFSISSLKGRAWRSFSSSYGESPPERASSFRIHARRLSKQRPPSSSSTLDSPSRRGSTISDDRSWLSLSTTESLGVATPASLSSVDWAAQHVEGCAPLESDTVLLKTKTPHLAVTRDYLVKTKSRADALALLPDMRTEATKHEARSSAPEPILVIPIAAIVSVFPAESTRPSFGFEVWWTNTTAGQSFCRSDFFFNNPTERNEQLHHVIRAMRANQQDENGTARISKETTALLTRVHEAEEPRFRDRKPDIFPVVPRANTRKAYMPKLEDATKKSQEGSAFYLVVGTYLCHLVEVPNAKVGEAVCRHKSYGLVTLESFKGEWIAHEERFNITFRIPFKAPATLELSSLYYRQIIRVFGTADRFLKPAWPQLWQSMEIFYVSGLKEPQYLVPKEDLGCFKRTLDAYVAAYRCGDVEWEINWKTRFAPEFRLLPAKCGPYTSLQILAVLRALRYNDYFNSLSFRDVDLSVLYGLEDNTFRKANVAYLSRTCVALGSEEVEMLQTSSVLHQEFHALAFCSETIRQIDFRNCTRSMPTRLAQRGTQTPNLQFLAPILNLLKSGITKCNRLILSGNILSQSDADDLAEAISIGAIQVLDVSSCGLDDVNLRDMIVLPLSERAGVLHSLSVSGNPGRLPAHILPKLLQYVPEIRDLNLRGSIRAESYIEGSLLPFATLESMERLEELDISGYKVDDVTFQDLERFLQYRSRRLDEGQPLRFHKLAVNHCGITGTQAAQLFRAIGQNRGLQLCLSGNPIEDGIDDLAAAIREQHGPAGLHLEMIEFKHEAHYLTLLQALTATRHLSLLSLAGTAPSPSSHGPCSDELVAMLHDLFARNASVRCLDLSGFSGKLDDGQLPRGFGRALGGISSNTALTHLRVRNQNLHDDAGALGTALAANRTLRAVDCRDNNWNLTSLRFLIDSLRKNPHRSLVCFPMPPAEREAIWRTVLRGLQRTPSSAALSAEGTVSAAAGGAAAAGVARDRLTAEEALLREMLERQFAALEERLRENRAAAMGEVGGNEEVGGWQALGLDARDVDGVGDGERVPLPRPRSGHQRSVSSASGLGVLLGLGAGVVPDDEGWPAFDFGSTDAGLGVGWGKVAGPRRPSSCDLEGLGIGSGALAVARPATVRSSDVGLETEPPVTASLLSVPYGYGHAQGSGAVVVGGMESPAETLDPVSEVEAPAEETEPDPVQMQVRVVGGVTPDLVRSSAEGIDKEAVEDVVVFRKMVDGFRAARFEI